MHRIHPEARIRHENRRGLCVFVACVVLVAAVVSDRLDRHSRSADPVSGLPAPDRWNNEPVTLGCLLRLVSPLKLVVMAGLGPGRVVVGGSAERWAVGVFWVTLAGGG
jgi:hypothetical protein